MTTRQKKIIVPVDFSASTSAAIQTGLYFAKLHGSELILLAVVEPSGLAIFADAADTEARTKAAGTHLDQLIQATAADGVKISRMVVQGKPYQEITKAADGLSAEMVVMGLGAAGAGDGSIGSNTGKVIRGCDCPVVTVKPNVNHFSSKRICIPVDPEFGIRELRGFLQQYHKVYNPEVTLVSVTGNTSNPAELKEYLLKQTDTLHKQGISNVSMEMLDAVDISRALVNFLGDGRTDMVWMETHGRTGIAHMFVGSITEEILSHSPVPVLSLKPVRRESHESYYHSNLPI